MREYVARIVCLRSFAGTRSSACSFIRSFVLLKSRRVSISDADVSVLVRTLERAGTLILA